MSNNEYRIKLQLKRPNPLFELWLEEWLREAIEKDSIKRYVLQTALQSLRKYPLVMQTGRECIILEGFGPAICQMLDKQLKKYNCENPGLLDETITKNAAGGINRIYRNLCEIYVQAAVSESKIEINDKLLTATTKTTTTTTTTLMKKNTFDIILLVDTQETTGKSKRSLDATIQALEKHSIIKYEVKRLSVGDFAWICRDKRIIMNQMNSGIELMLPYIIERKRMDDLAGSIRDGRFKEQKFRLTECGITNVIYLIESHGSNSNNKHLGLPLSNLLQAATNTEVHNGFSLIFTDSHTDSMDYIINLTKLFINDLYKNKDLMKINENGAIINHDYDCELQLMDFSVFQKKSQKMRNFTITDLFIRQLLQLKQLTIDKALAIVDMYPTPYALMERYRLCHTEQEAEHLLANIVFDKQTLNQKSIGIQISKIIYQLYNKI